METEERARKRSFKKYLRSIPKNISTGAQRFFYGLGFRIAENPLKWMCGCSVVVLLCLLGLLRFRQEKNPLNLWIPPESDFVRDTNWLLSNFGMGQRVETMILTGDDVLEPGTLLRLNQVTKRVLTAETPSKPTIAWTDVCFKVPVISELIGRERRSFRDYNSGEDFFDEEPSARMNKSIFDPGVNGPTDLYCKIVNSLPSGCLLISILDLWDYDSEYLKNQTKDDVISKINSARRSRSLGHELDFLELLGDTEIDDKGRVVSAKAVKTMWMVHVNFTEVRMNESGNDAGTADWVTGDVLSWESAFLHELWESSRYLTSETTLGLPKLEIWYESGRSWGDISSSTMFHDIGKIVIGVGLMFFYVQAILSRFNWLEWRFYLTAVGLLCVAGAFIVAVGLCSLLGVAYGPVHTSLPFMLMGLGVDDVFVISASWDQIMVNEANRGKSLSERIGKMLSHAGASIFVTSFTDVIALIIGASTILPSLQSFCIYAAVGVATTFVLQVTFFVAFFTLEVKRIESRRNAIIPCCVIHERKENENSTRSERLRRKSLSQNFVDFFYTKIVFTPVGKILTVCVTLALTIFGVLGACRLEQWFDPDWFIPEDNYLSDYMSAKNHFYPGRGHSGWIFIGDVDYKEEFPRIVSLVDSFRNSSAIIERVESWPRDFAEFVSLYYDKDLMNGDVTATDFSFYLSKFLFSRSGGKYQGKFRFAGNLTCGKSAPKILVAVVDFSFVKFDAPGQWIPAMDAVKKMASESQIQGFVTVWSRIFGSWVTDKVIAEETTRNLILALICVMGMTVLLIAEPQTCFWILICVLLTLVDVCGFMYYWGLTIDIASCIGLELAVGLSVDYATHVAHTFLNTDSPAGTVDSREARTLLAVRHIGAAVAFGAGSTLLAQSTMAFSKAYVFRAFFKIFFMVIVFGVWHGLVMLPVVLSTLGPRALRPTTTPPNDQDHQEMVPMKDNPDGYDLSGNKSIADQ